MRQLLSATPQRSGRTQPIPAAQAERESRPVRVIWSMLNLNPGFMGGTEEYATGLMHEVLASPSANARQVEIIALTTETGKGFATTGMESRVVRGLPGGRSFARRLRVVLTATLRFGRLHRLLEDAEVVFYPFTAMVPFTRRIPTCVVVHDLQHRELPKNFSGAQRIYRSLAYDRRITRATAIVAVSESTRASIVSRLGVVPERVRVIAPGIDTGFFCPAEDDARPVAGQPFLYLPARALPHKNHAVLFQAFALLRQKTPELRLVLTGGDRDRLGPLPPGVEHEGRVSRERVRELYRSTSALVFPSLFEGYGLPPLEAMGCGAPVACARAGSLEEVCGDAAEYFNPLSPTDMAAAIQRVLDDPGPYRERGRAQALKRTVADAAREYEALWREMANV